MVSSPLISVDELSVRLHDDRLRILDCRFDLMDKGFGLRAYREGHIRGAFFVDLEADLSDMRLLATRGRHPLPTMAQIEGLLARIGADERSEVVCYDAEQSAYAARAWWLLSRSTALSVRVLDGGLRAWQASGHGLSVDPAAAQRIGTVKANLPDDVWLPSADVAAFLQSGTLVDARGAPRFRGDNEPIDPVAGHVPGARNLPFTDNLQPDGRFKSPSELAQRFRPLVGESAADVAHMCGSGVTACHNLLAMEVAGLHGSRLYADSWSGWITDPARPVARGD